MSELKGGRNCGRTAEVKIREFKNELRESFYAVYPYAQMTLHDDGYRGVVDVQIKIWVKGEGITIVKGVEYSAILENNSVRLVYELIDEFSKIILSKLLSWKGTNTENCFAEIGEVEE
jgi:hypothetical protein